MSNFQLALLCISFLLFSFAQSKKKENKSDTIFVLYNTSILCMHLYFCQIMSRPPSLQLIVILLLFNPGRNLVKKHISLVSLHKQQGYSLKRPSIYHLMGFWTGTLGPFLALSGIDIRKKW